MGPMEPQALRSAANFILSLWLIIAMGFVILLAYLFPQVGRSGGTVRSEYTVTYGCVAFIFFTSGLSIPRSRIYVHLCNVRLHLLSQITCYFTTSSTFFALATFIRRFSPNSVIDTSTLVGFIATGCLPTGIAANVVLTRQAKGDVAASTLLVLVGNVLGPFLSPILITHFYLSAYSPFREWLPDGADSNLSKLYTTVMKQFGLTLFLPLFTGQVLLFFFPKACDWVMKKLYLGKLSSLCLLALVWSTFCGLFATNASNRLPTQTVVLDVFLNFLICTCFTAFCFLLARPPKFLQKKAPKLFRSLSKEETASLCLCAPTKTQALGVPLVYAMWISQNENTRSLIQLPIILYNAEQIMVGQLAVPLFKRWIEKDVTDESVDPEQINASNEATLSTSIEGTNRENISMKRISIPSKILRRK